MMIHITPFGKYNTNLKNINDSDPITVIDHLDGFSIDAKSSVLAEINLQTNECRTVHCEYIPNTEIKNNYSKLEIKFDINTWFQENNISGIQPKLDHNKNITKFLCSFNNSGHIGRILLTSALNSYGYFDPETCSKNFVYRPDKILSSLHEEVRQQDQCYKMFFFQNNVEEFSSAKFIFGMPPGRDHGQNQEFLSPRIDKSFLHLVSETMATSYYPFVTEKFFYSVAAGNLFLAYAQPDWHDHVTHWFGFRQYNKIFDYYFDSIKNPVMRLITLMDMISKFSKLSLCEWNELYKIEQETIDYNYEHFASGRYLVHLHRKITEQQGITELGSKILQKIK
jgi:hypothetical protein